MTIEWRAFVRAVTGSWKTAEMALHAAELQALYGACYASARTLAGAGLGSKKTWGRVVAALRDRRLAQTWRLQRPGGRFSTNLLDLSLLWRAFLAAEGQMKALLFRLHGDILALPRAWAAWWGVNSQLILEDPGSASAGGLVLEGGVR